MRDTQESMASTIAFQAVILGLLIYAAIRKSRIAVGIIITADLFFWRQGVNKDDSPPIVTTFPCPQPIAVSAPYNWFSDVYNQRYHTIKNNVC